VLRLRARAPRRREGLPRRRRRRRALLRLSVVARAAPPPARERAAGAPARQAGWPARARRRRPLDREAVRVPPPRLGPRGGVLGRRRGLHRDAEAAAPRTRAPHRAFGRFLLGRPGADPGALRSGGLGAVPPALDDLRRPPAAPAGAAARAHRPHVDGG